MYSRRQSSASYRLSCESKPMPDLIEKNNKRTNTVFHGSYLGSAVLTNGKTGLGSLQDPLRELYCIFKDRRAKLVQQRRLVITLDGITMLYNEMGIEKSLHTDLTSVHDVILLKLSFEKRTNNLVYSAFLPLGK
jgi:hypothetical protein